jgi:hypothetical protein
MGGAIKRSTLVLGLLIVLLTTAFSSSAAATQVTAGAWSIATSPSSSEQLNGLTSVTCVTATDCWSVGAEEASGTEPPPSDHPLFEHWDGTMWSIVSNPGPTEDFVFVAGVACAASDDCWVVGSTSDLQPPNPQSEQFFEHWNGFAWSNISGPILSDPSASTVPEGLTCLTGSDCWAVGSETDVNGGVPGTTLTEHWDGASWSVVSSPDADPSSINALRSVSCVDSTDCWSVGEANVGPSPQTLAEHWNGAAWTIVSTSNVVGSDNQLASVTCTTADDCWSVGASEGSTGLKTLFEHWNGSAWSIVPSPNAPTSSYDDLISVTCAASSDCWSVGDIGTGKTLVEHWDGSGWSIVVSANTSRSTSLLSSVFCRDSSNCWAVGQSSTKSSPRSQPLVEWLVQPAAITLNPTAGPAGTSIAVTGSGFGFDKPIKVRYLKAPGAKVTVCRATSTANGGFACTGSVALKRSGALGSHTVTASGPSSVQASTTFTLS